MKNRMTLRGIMKTSLQPACYVFIAVLTLVWVSAAVAGDGRLLRRESDQICYGCHKIETDHTKVNAGALRIHNSASTASEKWGESGWGVADGKYGEFKCTTCHTTHNTQNIFLIKETMTAPNAPADSLPGSGVDFRTRLGTPGVTIGTMADDTNHDTTSTNVCRVCHSKNKVHNYNWALNAEEHHNADNCSNCHSHDKGFSVQCGECHGDKNAQPVTGLPISLETLVNKLGGTGSVTPGKHEKHYTVQKYICKTCHGTTAHDTQIEICFNFKDKNSGTYSGRALSNGFTYNACDSTTVTGAGGMKCTNIYCHSNAAPLGKANAYREVAWDGAATTCASCHDQKGSSAAHTDLSGAHSRHVDDGWYRFTCNKCHNDTVSDNSTIKDRTKHVNATKDVAFTEGGSYNGTAHSCSSVYCHSNAKLGTSAGAYATPVWDAGATTCSSCHGAGSAKGEPGYASGAAGSETANSHPRHTSKNIGCQKCHALTTTTGTTITGYSAHVNSQVDVWFNPLSTLSDSVGTYTPGVGNKTCSISRCHGSGTPQWGGVVVCGTCHVIDKTLAGRHSSHFGLAANHGVELKNGDGTIAAGNVSSAGQYVFKCGTCHYNTVHGGGAENDNRAAEVLFDTDNAGGGTYAEGSSQGQDVNTSYNWTAGACSSTYCHSQGTTTTAPYLAPVNNSFNWATSANIDADYNIKCRGCHKYTTASGAAMDSGNHGRHVTTYTMNCAKCHNATTTTGTTITDRSKHVNRAKDVSWDATNTGGAAYNSTTHGCDNIYCHSTGRSNASPYPAPNTVAAWTGGVLGCAGCHGGDSTTAPNKMSTYSHSKHIDSTVSDKFKCEMCHSATVSQNTTIISTTKHVNRTVDISFSSPNSDASYNGTPNQPVGISKVPGTVPTPANATCSGLYCHSQGTSLSAPSVPNKAAVWGGSLNDSCSGCHSGDSAAAYIMISGSHSGHINNAAVGVNYACDKCHNVTVQTGTSRTIAGTAKHLNKKINVQFTNVLNPAGSYSKSGEFDPGSAGGTCSSLYCHSNGKTGTAVARYENPAWGATWTNVCNGCHGATNKNDATNPNGAPDYATGAGTENSHAKHAMNTAASQNYNCSKCHNQTTTTGTSITGAVHIDQSVQVSFDAANSGANAYGTPGAKQCSNLYCHSNANNSYSTVTWGGAAMTCTSCHDSSRANDSDNANPAQLSARHSMHIDTGLQNDTGMGTQRYGLTCNRCHSATAASNAAIANRSKHADNTKDVVFSEAGGSFNSTAKDCSNIYCHSQARTDDNGDWKAPYKAVKWSDTTLDMKCFSCHKGATDDDNEANCLVIGGTWYDDGTASTVNNKLCKSKYSKQADCVAANGTLNANGSVSNPVGSGINSSWNSSRVSCDSPYTAEADCTSHGLTWLNTCWAPSGYDTESECNSVGGLWALDAEKWNCFYYSKYLGYNLTNNLYNNQTNCEGQSGVWTSICVSPYNTKANCDNIGGVWDAEKQACKSSFLSMSSNGHARLIGRDWIRQYPCFYCHDATMTAECTGGTINEINCENKGGVWNGPGSANNSCSYISEAECKDATLTAGVPNGGGAGATWSEYVKDKSKHADGVKTIAVNSQRWGLKTGAALNPPSYNTGTRVCNNVYCHTDGTDPDPSIKDYAWTGGHKECDGCHGHEGTNCAACHEDGRSDFTASQKWFKAMPMYATDTNAGKYNSHARHIFSTFSCEACHAKTVAGGGSCKACHDSNPTGAMAEVGHVNGLYHVNKQKDVDFSNDIGGSYDKWTHTCSGTACHTNQLPQWGGTIGQAATSCFSCHGNNIDKNAANADTDDFQFSASAIGSKGSININQWKDTGHGRTAASGVYSGSGNPAANFPDTGSGVNPCGYCHDDTIMHNDTTNPFRLRKHKQFEAHFEKECVYCHMEGNNDECRACHDSGESIAPQLSSINRVVSQRPDHRGWSGTSQSCIITDLTISGTLWSCHSNDATRHNTGSGSWNATTKADIKNQYVFIGVCLKCHDDDTSGQCSSCHGSYNAADCVDSNLSAKKYARGFNPTANADYCRKPSTGKASAFHFGYKHNKFFTSTGGWTTGSCSEPDYTNKRSCESNPGNLPGGPFTWTSSAEGDHTEGVWKGGKFCWDCHDPHGDNNIYMVHNKVATETDGKFGIPVPGKMARVIFTSKAQGSYANTDSPPTGICNVCHETLVVTAQYPNEGSCSTAGGTWKDSACIMVEAEHYTNQGSDLNHNTYIEGGMVCTNCHEHRFGQSHANGQECNTCHLPKPIPRQDGFSQPRDCTKCHAGSIGNRMNIMSQMKWGTSHHAQLTDGSISNKHCYACHWEATEMGLINTDYVEHFPVTGTASATGGSNKVKLVDSSRNWTTANGGQWKNYYVVMTSGSNNKQSRLITGSDATTLNFAALDNVINSGDTYKIVKYMHQGYNFKTRTGVKDDETNLVIWQPDTSAITVGTRPVVYSASTAATFYATSISAVFRTDPLPTEAEKTAERLNVGNVTNHCLSCHSDQNNDAQPFSYCSSPLYTTKATCESSGNEWISDCKTPRQYAWDRMSIAARYSQTGTTKWGKYTTTENASKKDITKAYSAHGNSASNYGGGWDSSTCNAAANVTSATCGVLGGAWSGGACKNISKDACNTGFCTNTGHEVCETLGGLMSGTACEKISQGACTAVNYCTAMPQDVCTARGGTWAGEACITTQAICNGAGPAGGYCTNITSGKCTEAPAGTWTGTACINITQGQCLTKLGVWNLGTWNTKDLGAGTWTATNSTWSSGTGIDGVLTTTRGGGSAKNVQCFDCHSSHGSKLEGITSSYSAYINPVLDPAPGPNNGANLKETLAGKGGYVSDYMATTGTGAVNPYNAGTAQCFDCHESPAAGTQIADYLTPWGYQTFGAAAPIRGYRDAPKFGEGENGTTLRSPYKARGMKGGHMKRSSDMATAPKNTINGLCTPCHDPHGVSPTLGSNMQYAVPLLKGTWLTSPYKEDMAPSDTVWVGGGGGSGSGGGYDGSGSGSGGGGGAWASVPGFNIDQNTFAAWIWNSASKISQTDSQFAGLCLTCHPKTDIRPNVNADWKTYSRVHNTVKDWGGRNANVNNAIHAFPCSKCHVPHTSDNPRLMSTNCLEAKHRGKVASGGVPGSGGGSFSGNGNGGGPNGGGGGAGAGSGAGAFPFGGSGSKTSGGSGSGSGNDGGGSGEGSGGGSHGFKSNNLTPCHFNTNSDAVPAERQKWNTKTPW